MRSALPRRGRLTLKQQSPYSGQPTRTNHLDFAIAEFQDMKTQPALERALGRRGLLKAYHS